MNKWWIFSGKQTHLLCILCCLLTVSNHTKQNLIIWGAKFLNSKFYNFLENETDSDIKRERERHGRESVVGRVNITHTILILKQMCFWIWTMNTHVVICQIKLWTTHCAADGGFIKEECTTGVNSNQTLYGFHAFFGVFFSEFILEFGFKKMTACLRHHWNETVLNFIFHLLHDDDDDDVVDDCYYLSETKRVWTCYQNH